MPDLPLPMRKNMRSSGGVFKDTSVLGVLSRLKLEDRLDHPVLFIFGQVEVQREPQQAFGDALAYRMVSPTASKPPAIADRWRGRWWNAASAPRSARCWMHRGRISESGRIKWKRW